MPFQNFPYTNFQNLNLDWILKTMKEAVEQVDGAYEAAEDALEAANSVQGIANQANATAAGASAAATNAVHTANAAETKADTAMSNAASAITTAAGAVATANGASSQANSAYQNSVTAMSRASEAISRASSAENTAQQALDTVATKNTKIFMTGYGSSFADTQGNPLTRSQIISKITAGDNLYFVSSDTKEIWLLFSANTDVFSIFHISHDNNNADRLRIITIPTSGTITTNSYPFSGASGAGIFLIDAERVAGQNGVYYTFDKTPSQIYDAILAGMLPVVRYSDVSTPAQPIYKYYVMAFYQFDGEDAYVHFARQDETVFETMRYIASEQKAYQRAFDQKDACVTPEMFGAVGDGVSDDTVAIQAAVNSGANVKFAFGKTYKCGTINVNKNINIDCAWANFICTGEILFNCAGSVTESVAGADYVAFAPYELTGYSGMAMIRSSENTITEKSSLRAGFAAIFENGVCSDRVPSSFGNVTIDKINPITVTIKHVANIVFDTVRNFNTVIKCLYGFNSLFEEIHINGDMYSVIRFEKCRNCAANRVNGYVNYTGTEVNYYPFDLVDSSFCKVENCTLRSEWWHCWTTGGIYYCINNSVEHCDFSTTGYAHAVLDHPCGMGTRVIDSIIDNITLSGNGVVDGCTIRNTKVASSGTKGCIVILHPTNIQGANHFTVKNTNFLANNASPNLTIANFGIGVKLAADNVAVAHVIDDVLIENVHTIGDANADSFGMLNINGTGGNANTTLTINGTISIDNAQGIFHCNSATVFNQTNCKLVIRNTHRYAGHAVTIGLGANTYYPKWVNIENCTIGIVRGNFNELNLNNVFSGAGTSFINASTSVITALTGMNVPYIEEAALLKATRARILGMKGSNGQDTYSAVYVSGGVASYVEQIPSA